MQISCIALCTVPHSIPDVVYLHQNHMEISDDRRHILDLSFEKIEEGSYSDSDNDNGYLGDLDLELRNRTRVENFADVDGQGYRSRSHSRLT